MTRSSLLLFVGLAVIVLVDCQKSEEMGKVFVQVYYESLCPDSKKFINRQLYPALNHVNRSLPEYVDLRLIPYGKSSFIYDKNSRVYNFSCHHGDIECVGNKYHACVLNNTLSTQPPPRYVLSSELDFVNCLMAMADKHHDAAAVFPIKECALSAAGIHVANLENCAHHNDGQQYLHSFGVETENLKPALSSVPTILLDGERSESADADFVGAICARLTVKYPKAMPPPACVSSGSARVISWSWFTTLVLVCILGKLTR